MQQAIAPGEQPGGPPQADPAGAMAGCETIEYGTGGSAAATTGGMAGAPGSRAGILSGEDLAGCPEEPSTAEASGSDVAAESMGAAAARPEGTPESVPATDGDPAGQEQQLAELSASLAGVQGRLETTLAALADAEAARAALQAELAGATNRYRDAVLAGCPEIPADLVSGASIEEVDASLGRAKEIVERIARNLVGSTMPVPNGAPPRRAPDLSGLTPIEKIRFGLAAQNHRG